ncbi:hypothetical protein BDZ89DRAFT_1069055 [Hymenopellis radicata]|nr:hypothetical protein BDZ89DRAFT_1069055 [Hymenopellis radicata]
MTTGFYAHSNSLHKSSRLRVFLSLHYHLCLHPLPISISTLPTPFLAVILYVVVWYMGETTELNLSVNGAWKWSAMDVGC